MNTDKITPLSPILVDQRRFVVQKARRKNREHTGIWIGQCLTRTKDVEEAQRHRSHAVGAPNRHAQSFLVILGNGVDRRQGGTFRFRRGDWNQRLTGVVSDFPVMRLELFDRSLPSRNDFALPGAIQTLAINAHTGGNDQPLDRPLRQCLE